ncbi:MAG: flagellar biosynthesis anti-sigma factor FlgM [Pseudomonadales bacterium]|nr:flagellar biosynthesis anti-sigma factor FlgM [Pseudomonadales bacterium]
MPIDFNGISSSSSASNRTKATETGKASAAAPVVKEGDHGTSAGSEDKVSLSGEAKALHQLEEQIKALPVTDQDKVNNFRTAIADGTYQPNPENIATKMLDADTLF